MASFSITPGLNKIIGANGTGTGDAICLLNTDGANRNVASGDVVTLLNGTYTFSTAQAILLDSGGLGLGGALTSLTIQGESQSGVILDISGVTFDAIYGGNATNVTLKNLTIIGTPGQSIFRDHSGSPMTGWTIENITVGNTGLTTFTAAPLGGANQTFDGVTAARSVFFYSPTGNLGTGVTVRNITTTSAYQAINVVSVTGVGTNLDLTIDGIDARAHVSLVTDGVDTATDPITQSPIANAVLLTNCRDVRVSNVKSDYTRSWGIKVQSSNNTHQSRDISISNVFIAHTAQTGLHVGNTAPEVARTYRVHLRNITVEDALDGYGIEFENSVQDSSLIGFTVRRVQRYGVALAECTENIIVTGGTIDTVGDLIGGAPGANASSGIITSTGRRHKITENIISNCVRGLTIQHDASQHNPNDGGVDSDGVTTGNVATNTQRTLFRDNVMMDVDYAYQLNTSAMPSTGGATMAHMLGPNTIFTPSLAFCRIDGVNKTQAELEATFPSSIEHSDTVVAGSRPPKNLLVQSFAINTATPRAIVLMFDL